MSAPTEFIPTGKMVKTDEQFPDLEDALGELDAPKKGGKGGKNKNKKVRNEVKKEVAPEDDVNLTPYKGKPSNFFVMD